MSNNTKEIKKGGRGKCKYCGKYQNNVSYHEAWECFFNSKKTREDEIKKLLNDIENQRQVKRS